MDQKRIHYGLAAISFFVALLTFGISMQPTVPFWDCGEFAAAAAGLGVPHPPGTPLWTLWGHIGMMIPIFTDIVARYNFLSVLCASFTVMMLYSSLVMLIKIWRGAPKSAADMVVHYGGAFLGAMAFTWSDSVWFNSTECVVFAPGLLFISLILWLMLVWYERADDPHSEKFLMLIFYLIGLSLGVHQMSMLAFFPVWMTIYYRRWPRSSVGGWFVMVALSLVAFAFIFKVVLTGLVDWAGKGLGIVSVLIIASLVGGIIYSMKEKKTLLNNLLWAGMFVFLGYTTYGLLMVRGAQNPPMDQHHPSTFTVLSEYINRSQYGEVTLSDEFNHRRLESQNQDHSHDATFNNYTSDFDFFWRYQTNHMFTRYLGWNFIGRQNDEQDAGVDYSKTWALPFLLGLFGVFWHFKRDPKRALTLLGGFIIMGYVTAWYQNQQDPQPRERDYFYVGAFYIYAIWIGIGAVGILEWIRSRGVAKSEQPAVKDAKQDGLPIVTGDGNMTPVLIGLVALLVIGPINQLFGLAGLASGDPLKQSSKFGEYSRYHDNVPFEYAYNFLQSCAPNAILFTAGDNDTFPLWCLQDAYGIRRDIRIVNLSLGNMGWYIKKLKEDTLWGVGLPLNLPGFTDQILSQPDDTQEGLHPDAGPAQMVNVPVSAAAMAKFSGKAEPGTLSWKYTGQFPREGGQYFFTIADQLVREVVEGNINDRPIYFASLVPASYMTGLEGHLMFEGLSARVVPMDLGTNTRSLDVPMDEAAYREFAFHVPKQPSLTPERGMYLYTFRDPKSNRSALEDRYAQTYYHTFFRLASYYTKSNRLADARMALDTAEARIPPEHMEPAYRYADVFAELYEAAGDSTKALKYARMAVDDMKANKAEETTEDQQQNASTMFHLAEFYLKMNLLDSARTIYQSLDAQMSGGDKQVMDFKLLEVDGKLLEKKGDKRGAYAKYDEAAKKFGSLAGTSFGGDYAQVVARHDALRQELGIVDTAKPTAPAQQMIQINPQQGAPGHGGPPPGAQPVPIQQQP
jgi:hypothetical protein